LGFGRRAGAARRDGRRRGAPSARRGPPPAAEPPRAVPATPGRGPPAGLGWSCRAAARRRAPRYQAPRRRGPLRRHHRPSPRHGLEVPPPRGAGRRWRAVRQAAAATAHPSARRPGAAPRAPPPVRCRQHRSGRAESGPPPAGPAAGAARPTGCPRTGRRRASRRPTRAPRPSPRPRRSPRPPGRAS
jgi:hypothetical protein